MTTAAWREIEELNALIHNISIHQNGKNFTYTDLCSKWGEDCHENDIIELGEFIDKFETGDLKIGYPVTLNPVTYNAHTTGYYFSGVKLNSDGSNIESAKTVALDYFVTSDESEEQKLR